MSSLISDIFGLRPKEPIAATTGLETPQVIVRWKYQDSIKAVDRIIIRRSTSRFPESITEGDSVLNEFQAVGNPRTSYADTNPKADVVNYYSVFFQQKGPYSVTMDAAFDIERLGTLRSVLLKESPYTGYWILVRDEQGKSCLYAYDSIKRLVTRKIDLSAIINEKDEQGLSIIAFVVDGVNDTVTYWIVTNRRFIQVKLKTLQDTAATTDVVTNISFTGLLTSGYRVDSGSTFGSVGITAFGGNVIVLDTTNKQVVQFTPAGSLVSKHSFTGVKLPGEARGITYGGTGSYYIGFGKNIYGITPSNNMTNASITDFIPLRQQVNGGIYYDGSYSGSSILVLDNDLQQLQRYQYANLNAVVQVEEPVLVSNSMKGIWRLDEATGTFSDDSGSNLPASVSGSPARAQPGKFNKSVQLLAATDFINLNNSASLFNMNQGYVSFWYKLPYKGYRVSGSAGTLFRGSDGGSNSLRIYMDTDGSIKADVTRGGATVTCIYANGQSAIDDGQFHQIVLSLVSSGTAARLYVDGVIQSNATPAGGTVPVLTTLSLGLNGSSQKGYYEDLAMYAGGTATIFSRYTVTTRGNRAHAYAGRDYATTAVNWRDDLKKEFGEYLLRNDYGVEPLPQNVSLADGEVIFRQDIKSLTIGNLGRLSRLFGLLLDRTTDYRRFFMNHLNSNKVEYEYVDEIGELIGADDINPAWNVDQRKRYLETMYFCNQRSGTYDAFYRMARFLGFRLAKADDIVGPIVQAHRSYFDSCLDPDVQDVPFDTNTFDSQGSDVQFVDILLRLFQQNRSASTGASGVVSGRIFTDTTATFLTQAEPGSLLIVNDQSTPGDNGQYIIKSVLSNTSVLVDRDWPTGSLSNLQYRLHWRVPAADPYCDMLLQNLNKIKVRWQNLLVNF